MQAGYTCLGGSTSILPVRQSHLINLTTMTVIQPPTTGRQVVARECRFAIHVPKKGPEDKDWHVVKEVIHYDDNTTEANLRTVENFERPMWTTKPAFRNHKEKKEFEKVERLMMKKVTQSDLRDAVAKAQDKSWSRASLRELSAWPYLYGTDISSTCIIKQTQYRMKWPNTITPYRVCTFDTETNMLDGSGEIIMASAAFEGKVVFSVRKDFVEKYSDPAARFRQACKKYLPEYFKLGENDPLPFEIEWLIADTEIDIVKQVFKRIHEWKPDFLAIWNVDFDVTKVLEACERAGVNPEDILCDPSLPNHIRRCYYKRGQTRKVTAAGKSQPINPASQWHSLFLTASFYVIDAMCVYRLLRLSKQEMSEYNLDFVLKANKLGGKLSFAAADSYIKDAWHTFMQANYIFEYMVYNVVDSYAMLQLDKKTKDLSNTLPDFAASTDFWDFNSQPKRLRDAMFWEWLTERKCIIGTVGPKPKVDQKELERRAAAMKSEGEDFADEDDDEEGVDDDGEDAGSPTVLSRRGWVLTLPAHLNVLGLKLLKGEKLMRTLLRAFIYDSDAVSAYPRCVIVSNYSKATTRKELTGVRGIPERVFRLQNLNMVIGDVNALDYSRTMLGMPQSRQLLEDFMKTS